MNKDRRDRLKDVLNSLEDLKGIIDTAATEEREEFDELPQEKQESDKGQLIDQAASNLEEAVEKFDDLTSLIHDARG